MEPRNIHLSVSEDPEYPALPGQLWIGIAGISNNCSILTSGEHAVSWLENHSTGRLWNVALCDPVELFLIPFRKAKLTDKPPEEDAE